MHNSPRSVRITLAIAVMFMAKFLGAQNARSLVDQYKHKFVVVQKEGLFAGSCGEKETNGVIPPPYVVTQTIDNGVVVKKGIQQTTCQFGARTPIHSGEIMTARIVALGHLLGEGHVCGIAIANTSPHAIERGEGAYAHQSYEVGEAVVTFKLDGTDDVGQCASHLSEWFRVFDTHAGAAKAGNTASGVYVKEVKSGMTFAEVESALGPPQTKIVLTDKVLYKYPNMTIEFHDEKVADVR